MANRFAVGDTLGYQVYNQYLNQEIARKRAEEERRKQEEQRSKAKKHNAFGQLVNTAGSVIGAGVGLAASGGNPAAGLAGYQMGSAGSNLLMNLFPNIGGTEPDSSNPYYDKPSNMQVANQALGVGLQAYGQYNQYLGEQAKANLTDFTKSLITDPNRPKAMTVEEISDAIKESKEYEDAKGIFGESVLSDNTVRQIAQNAYDGVGQQAIKMFDMIQKAPVNENTQPMVDKWFSRYGDAYSNLMPEGMRENLTTSVTETVDKKNEGDAFKLIEIEMKRAETSGQFDPEPFLNSTLAKTNKPLADAFYRLAQTQAESYKTSKDLSTKAAAKEDAQARLKIVTDGIKSMDENAPPKAVQYMIQQAIEIAPVATNMPKEQAEEFYKNLLTIKTTPSASGDFEKSITKLSEGFVRDLMGTDPTQMQMSKESATAHIVDNFGAESELARRMLLIIHESPEAAVAAVQAIREQDRADAREAIRKKEESWFNNGSIVQDLLRSLGSKLGIGGSNENVSQTQLGIGAGKNSGLSYDETKDKLGLD